jgi:hypothetical protein
MSNPVGDQDIFYKIDPVIGIGVGQSIANCAEICITMILYLLFQLVCILISEFFSSC